jgi:hypothetical protein
LEVRLIIFYTILMEEVGESQDEDNILAIIIIVSRVNTSLGYPGCLIE